jgi:tetratricopeptide (TPR) repeat protein
MQKDVTSMLDEELLEPSAASRTAATGELADLVRHGSDMLKAKRPERARASLERAYQIDPRDAKVRNLLGLAYFKLGLLEAAKAIYDALVDDYPSEVPLYVNLGLVLLRQGRLQEAEQALVRALRISPDHARAHCYLGLVLYRRGQLVEAREHFLRGDAKDFALKVERRLAREGDERRPSHAEMLRQVADEGVQGLLGGDVLRAVDVVRDERLVRDESAWQTSVSHSQPPSRTFEDPASLLPWPASQLPAPAPVEDVAAPTARKVSGTSDLPEALVYGRPPPSEAPSREAELPELSGSRDGVGFTAGPGPRARLEVRSAAYLRPSTIVAASGRMTMTEAERHFNHRATGGVFGDPADPMSRLEGRAVLILRVAHIAVALRGASDLHVVQGALVGFDDGFSWDNGRILGLDVVTLRGRGSLLLDTRGPPMLMPVDEETPVHSAVDALLAWSDGVRPSPIETKRERSRLFKLHGRGYVLVQLPDDGEPLEDPPG